MSASKLYCEHCGTLCADLIAGSKTRKGMVVLCKMCWVPEPLADKATPANDDGAVDMLRRIFGMRP